MKAPAMSSTSRPNRQRPDAAADLDEAVGLLQRALVQDLSTASALAPPAAALRERLLRRVGDSASRHAALHTVRERHAAAIALAPGVQARWLYRSPAPAALRPGEPGAVIVLELAAGATLRSGAGMGAGLSLGLGLAGSASEWLVLRGGIELDGIALDALDHYCRGAAQGEPRISSRQGATVYLRSGASTPLPGHVSRARGAQWHDYAPGIQRRVIWQEGSEVCYIARAMAGAAVPPHDHHHVEECLMLDGDVFTGDILLRSGEFQLAPIGFVHGTVQAATDALVYLRGDAELAIVG